MKSLILPSAEDDPLDSVNNSLVYYIALKQAGVPVEMHLYAHGGHAFGLRRTQFSITAWPQLMETWLATIGMISQWRLCESTTKQALIRKLLQVVTRAMAVDYLDRSFLTNLFSFRIWRGEGIFPL